MRDLIDDASEIMDAEFGEEKGYQDLLAEEQVRSAAAKAIYTARIAAGLTQEAACGTRRNAPVGHLQA